MSFTIHTGDVLNMLRTLPDESVQCVVTSPPYWGLRDYGVDGMIGLEPTLEEHLAKIVEVFREVRRVLRGDGTLWLNYGDSYAGSAKGGHIGKSMFEGHREHKKAGRAHRARKTKAKTEANRKRAEDRLAPKQRLLMPARVALALQDDGWWVRSEIVWAKGVSLCPTYSGKCMPSSVRDRPTDSHEMIYLLCKSSRYFYDLDAVREKGPCPAGTRAAKGSSARKAEAGVNARPAEYAVYSRTRNLRTVWTINVKNYKEAHFATFPEALVKPCILAGTSEQGACSECGAPWRRRVEVKGETLGKSWHDHANDSVQGNTKGKVAPGGHPFGGRPPNAEYTRTTTGWEPTCEHADAPTRPCVVLDPFNGSGTTGAVAVRHGRDYVGIELNSDYVELARKRIGRVAADMGQGGTTTADKDKRAAQLGLFA